MIRDSIGKKPLFVAKFANGTYFGSTLLALVAASGESKEVQPEMLEHFWKDGHVRPNDAILKDCFPVLPGQIIELDWNGDVAKVSPLNPETIEDLPTSGIKEIQQVVSHLLDQSVRRRLTNNLNPVCLLSGGIDSTVVAKHMKQQGIGSAITLGSLIPRGLDERYARYAAAKMQIPLQIVHAKSARLADDVVWALDLQDEPLGMMSFFPLALMVRSAKEYGKVLLTGDGGDEAFLGYGKPNDWLRPDNTVASGNDRPCVEVRSAPPDWMSDWGQHAVSESLLGHMFAKLDRASAEQGVEARCPLVDYDLMMYARKLRPVDLFFTGQSKALLKAELSDYPDWFVERRKMGFTYRLRWLWALRGFSGLRDLISEEAILAFEQVLPVELRKAPDKWSALSILNFFPSVWKLLVWSRFIKRLSDASDSSQFDFGKLVSEPMLISSYAHN